MTVYTVILAVLALPTLLILARLLRRIWRDVLVLMAMGVAMLSFVLIRKLTKTDLTVSGIKKEKEKGHGNEEARMGDPEADRG